MPVKNAAPATEKTEWSSGVLMPRPVTIPIAKNKSRKPERTEVTRILNPLWHNQGAYVAILGAVPRVAAASLIAYFLGEFANSYLLAKYKIRTAGK